MKRILFCRCSNADVIPEDTGREVLEGLSSLQAGLVTTPDLCGMAAHRDPILRELAAEGLTIIACHPRAVNWLLTASGADADPDRVDVLDMRAMSAASILEHLRSSDPIPAEDRADLPGDTGDWAPWFPVIDHDRCKNCKQCLGFCLFGVYELSDDGRVIAANPRNCKNNCPACARICPEAAIIFPKLHEEPLNGAEIGDEASVKAMIRINTEKILGDDIYAALAERSRKRKTLLARRREQAENERAACSGGGGQSAGET